MEEELLRIFDDQGSQIGTATREEVHKVGHWHETFHYWLISGEKLYFQKRSSNKKDYPNLLDITAAGHLLANETVEDGIREVKEEIGVDVPYNKLLPLGVIKYHVKQGELIDKELAHCFLHDGFFEMEDFKLQKEEVSGMFKVELSSFEALWFRNKESIQVEGFVVNDLGQRVTLKQNVTKNDFVPHEDIYYEQIIRLIKARG